MKKAILLALTVALAACQTQQETRDNRVRFTYVRYPEADPNCPWCILKQRCQVPSCPYKNQ